MWLYNYWNLYYLRPKIFVRSAKRWLNHFGVEGVYISTHIIWLPIYMSLATQTYIPEAFATPNFPLSLSPSLNSTDNHHQWLSQPLSDHQSPLQNYPTLDQLHLQLPCRFRNLAASLIRFPPQMWRSQQPPIKASQPQGPPVGSPPKHSSSTGSSPSLIPQDPVSTFFQQ